MSYVFSEQHPLIPSSDSVEKGSVDQAKYSAIPAGENLPPAPIDGSIDKWFFISGAAV